MCWLSCRTTWDFFWGQIFVTCNKLEACMLWSFVKKLHLYKTIAIFNSERKNNDRMDWSRHAMEINIENIKEILNAWSWTTKICLLLKMMRITWMCESTRCIQELKLLSDAKCKMMSGGHGRDFKKNSR